jgi:hypothetical protein
VISEYDPSKVKVTIGGVEVHGSASGLLENAEVSLGYAVPAGAMSGKTIMVDSVTPEYAEACAAGRAYGFGGKRQFTEDHAYWIGEHEAPGVPPKTLRERGWKWRR